MKAFIAAAILLASLTAAGVLQAASTGVEATRKAKPEQSMWAQSPPGFYNCWCVHPDGKKTCILSNLCTGNKGDCGPPCTG